jgi:hypothetical protein
VTVGSRKRVLADEQGGGAWVAMLAVICLPFDTQGKQTF